MPELPEIEAWRRLLDPDVKRSPIAQAGPAHIATLKTFDPPLAALEGEGFQGARRRAKRFLFPTDDDELVLMVHLMSAGRLKYLAPGAKGPKTPMFRLRFEDGGELVLTEAGAKRRAGVWLLRPDALEQELAHLGPEADQLDAESLGRDPRLRLAPAALAAARPAADRGHRPRLGERDPPRRDALAVRALDPARRRGGRAPRRRDPLRDGARDRAAAEGRREPAVYRVHDRLGEPCWRCGTPLARVDFEEHTIYYCTVCQTEGRVLKDRRLSRLLR